MKTSAIKLALDGVYIELREQIALSPLSEHESLKELCRRMLRITRKTIGALRTALWWWLIKEPGQMPVLREFYNSLPKPKPDRDLTNHELYLLLTKFYFIESDEDKFLQFDGLREEIRIAVRNIESMKEYYVARRLTPEVFNKILARPIVTKLPRSSTSGMSGMLRDEKHHEEKVERSQRSSSSNQNPDLGIELDSSFTSSPVEPVPMRGEVAAPRRMRGR
jgi:hypothetical protein